MSTGSSEDSSVYSDYSDNSDSAESFSSIQNNIKSLSNLVKEFTGHLDIAEKKIAELHPHVETAYISQLDTVPFLESSPFRDQTFMLKPNTLPGMDATKRYKFSAICEHMRNYFFENKMVADDGTITLPSKLQKLFGLDTNKTSFIELLGKLRSVLV